MTACIISFNTAVPSGNEWGVPYISARNRCMGVKVGSQLLAIWPLGKAFTAYVSINSDGITEGDETFQVKLTKPIGAILAGDGHCTVTIKDAVSGRDL